MKDGCYLIMGAEGVRRMTKRYPGLARDEIDVFVKLTVEHVQV